MTSTETLAVVSPNRSGTFDCQALASGRTFDARDFVTNDPILGLCREGGYVWGSLRDDQGTLYSTMRRIAATPPGTSADGRQSLGGKHILLGTGAGDGMTMRKEARHAVDSAALSATLSGDNGVTIASRAGADGQPMELVLDPDTFSYRETGTIDVTGTLVVPPLQWYLPGRDSALLYLSQTWLVKGEVLGRPARGFLFWEEAWMPPGGTLYRDKDPLHDAAYTTWYSWANHWSDGTTEVGHFLFGQQDFHVGVVAHSDGTVTSARSMDAVVTRAADGYWHDGIDYTLDGVAWRCDPDPQGRMQLGNMPNPQQEGRIHRVEDTRTPELWMAWGESVPGNGEIRRP